MIEILIYIYIHILIYIYILYVYILGGVNIHNFQLFWCSPGYQGFDHFTKTTLGKLQESSCWVSCQIKGPTLLPGTRKSAICFTIWIFQKSKIVSWASTNCGKSGLAQLVAWFLEEPIDALDILEHEQAAQANSKAHFRQSEFGRTW